MAGFLFWAAVMFALFVLALIDGYKQWEGE